MMATWEIAVFFIMTRFSAATSDWEGANDENERSSQDGFG
jgi:hypothetical protein